MLLETLSTKFRKAHSVNATNSSFPAKIILAAEPTGDAGTATGASVLDFLLGGPMEGAVQNQLLVMPYSTGSNNDTYSVRVYGWRRLGDNPNTWIWRPCLLTELACTASSTEVGLAGRAVVATEMFADTITITTGPTTAGFGVNVVSPTGDVAAYALVDIKGFQKIELTFKTTSSPTDLNALVALL